MRVSDFDYSLPPELIAQEPFEPRDAARMLVLARGERTPPWHRTDLAPPRRGSDPMPLGQSADATSPRLASGGMARDGMEQRHARTGMEHRHVRDLPEVLRAGDLLVANRSRVLPARILGRLSGGGQAEFLLLRPLGPGRWE